jgi:outer membrane receptor for ferrienterochelin and colicin
VDIEGNITMRGSTNIEIWINGYPTHMNGNVLKVYLESLPADAIDRIEVIKNPSAKYMVEEGCHIINIVTSTKIRNSHFLSFGLGGSNRPSISPWVSYVLKNEKFSTNVYLGVSSTPTHKTEQSSSIFRQDGTEGFDTTASSITATENNTNRYTGTLALNLSYKIDSMNDLSFFGLAVTFPATKHSLTTTDQWYYLPQSLHYTYTNSQEGRDFNLMGMANLSWKHKFDNEGHNLSITLYDNLNYSNNERTLQRDYTLLEGILPSELSDFDKTYLGGMTNNSLTLSADYNRPLTLDDELTLGIAFNPSYNRNHSTPSFIVSPDTGHDSLDLLRRFVKTDRGTQTSASASWRHKWKSVTMTLGLRGYWNQCRYSLDAYFPDDTAYSYLYLKPSLRLTYRTKSMHYYRFAYSLATSMPSAENLSTSRRYDEDSYKVGNPDLKAGHTHSIDLSWNRYFASHGSVGIESYARLSTNDINYCQEAASDIDPYLGRLISYSMPYNVGSSYKAGVEGNVTYRPAAWLNFRLYANLYRSGYEVDHPKAGHYSSAMTSYSFRLNCWANIAGRLRLNLSGNYASPTQALFVERQGTYTVDMGLSADFWEKRLSVVLNVTDLFNWNRSQSWETNPYLLGYSTSHTDSRFVSLSLTLRFGKMELQSLAREGD